LGGLAGNAELLTGIDGVSSRAVPRIVLRRRAAPAWSQAPMENTTVVSVPQITRMIARIEDWKKARGKARGRAETDRVLGEAQPLFEDVGNMLTEMPRELLGRGRQR
jgi:hypothetical protein